MYWDGVFLQKPWHKCKFWIRIVHFVCSVFLVKRVMHHNWFCCSSWYTAKSYIPWFGMPFLLFGLCQTQIGGLSISVFRLFCILYCRQNSLSSHRQAKLTYFFCYGILLTKILRCLIYMQTGLYLALAHHFVSYFTKES
jgi:hypothetical protein